MNYSVLWRINIAQVNPVWLYIQPTGACVEFTELERIQTECFQNPSLVVYTNDKQILELSERYNVTNLSITDFETRYMFGILDVVFPKQNQPIDKSFLDFIRRLDMHYKMMAPLLPDEIHFSAVDNGYLNTIKWLSRSDVCVYPTESIMDKHVYCTRWMGAHYSELLKTGYILTSPKRDPKTLKGLRTDPERIKFVGGCAFVLIAIRKCKLNLDLPLNIPVWVSNVEIMAMISADSTFKFEVEDILLADITPVSSELTSIIDDATLVLSLSFGMAVKLCFESISNNWTMAFLRSIERARWITLYSEVTKQYPIQISGYGNGAMSFYCWAGDLSKICNFLKIRASVLKHSEYDQEELLLDDVATQIQSRYVPMEEEQEHERQHFNTI